MFVEDLSPTFFAFEDAELFEFLEVFGSGFAFGDAGVHEELNLAVGLGEDEFDEFLGVDLGGEFVFSSAPVSVMVCVG